MIQKMVVSRLRPFVVVSALGLTMVSLAACGDGDTTATARDVGAPPSVEDAGSEAGVVRLSDEQARTLAIRTTTAAREPVRFDVSLPGTVHPAPDFIAEVSSPLSGRIASMAVHEGERVAAGEVVAELESLELANLVAEYLEVRADLEYARTQVNRYRQLVERRISPEAVLERARADLSRAAARSSASHARLHSLGVTDGDLERWHGDDVDRPVLPIRSPIDGVVAEHLIELGQSVTAYQKMMTVIDPARVLVRGFVSPEDAAFVRPGDPVRVSAEAAAGRSQEAQVTTVSPALSEGSRSVTVNVLMPAEGGWPIPGQSVRLAIRVSPPDPLISVPLSAVEFEAESAVIFVRGENDRTWIRRPVEVARITSDRVIVAGGLEPGEHVATSQVFTLKAMVRFERFGEGD